MAQNTDTSLKQTRAKLPPRKRLMDDWDAMFDVALGALAGGGIGIMLGEAFGVNVAEANPMLGLAGPIIGVILGGLLGKKVSDFRYRNGTRQ